MDALGVHEARPKGEALGGIMVARDDQNGNLMLAKAAQQVLKDLERLRGGDGFVVDVTGDEHRINVGGKRLLDDLVQDKALVCQHGKLVDALAYMQIGQMQKPHLPLLKTCNPPRRRKSAYRRSLYSTPVRYSESSPSKDRTAPVARPRPCKAAPPEDEARAA